MGPLAAALAPTLAPTLPSSGWPLSVQVCWAGTQIVSFCGHAHLGPGKLDMTQKSQRVALIWLCVNKPNKEEDSLAQPARAASDPCGISSRSKLMGKLPRLCCQVRPLGHRYLLLRRPKGHRNHGHQPRIC